MNATAARGLTAIKQKIKKAGRENEALLGEYKEVSLIGARVHTILDCGRELTFAELLMIRTRMHMQRSSRAVLLFRQPQLARRAARWVAD